MNIISTGSGGWSASGMLQANTSKAVLLQADFGASGPFTAQFSLDQSAALNVEALPFSVTAEINWKVEGNWVRRIITLQNGTSITGIAQAVSVTIRDSGSINLGEYRVSVQVAPGIRGSVSSPPLFTPLTTISSIAAGSSITIPVPADHGIIGILLSAAYANGGIPLNPQDKTVIAEMRAGNPIVVGNRTLGWIDVVQNNNKIVSLSPLCTHLVVSNGGTDSINLSVPIFAVEG